jgi:beta-lactamase class A
MWWKNPVPWGVTVVAAALSFFIGRYLPAAAITPPQPLRLSGYQFISPLLSCNFNSIKAFSSFQPLNDKIESVINQHIQAGDISKASTYFADFKNGYWSNAFPNEEYYPSSLGKIPIMMAYFEESESDPSVLNKEINFPVGGQDLNTMQDIPPPQKIIPGQTYSVSDLIKYMIQDSDNNAAQLLYQNIDNDALRSVYADLQVPVDDDVTYPNIDIITPQQVGILFKILYNATYLSHDDSEKALQLMSGSSFTQGLVAGVPSSTVISHKLGLVGIEGGGAPTEHELHDCGIVYASDPYLLCVMTRGSSTLPTMEGVIADISKTVYNEVEGGYQ